MIRALARQNIDNQLRQEQLRQSKIRVMAEENAGAEFRRQKELAENLTVNDLFCAWLEDGVPRKDGNAELHRSFTKDILVDFGEIVIKNLTEYDIRAVLRKLVD